MTYRYSTEIITYAVLVLGYVEGAVGIMQWIGMMPTLHYSYPFTGTFYNPGPYACFLSIVIPVAVYAAGKSQSRLAQWSGTGMVLIGAILIPASLSRTAMLAALAGSALALRGSIMPRIREAGRGWLIAGILALSVGDLELCRREAETMLRMEVKIKSPATEEMLEEARRMIDNWELIIISGEINIF